MPIASRTRNGLSDVAQEARGIAHEVLHWLNEIAEAVKKQLSESQTLYVSRALNTGIDTAVSDTVGPPPGVIWEVKRVAITSGANSGFAIYLNEAQPQNLLEGEFNNAQIAAFDSNLVVPPQQSLVLRFFGQPNNQICTVNLRVVEIAVEE